MRRLINLGQNTAQSVVISAFSMLAGAVILSAPAEAEATDRLTLDKHVFEQFCTPEGGYAGIFGTAETAAQAALSYENKSIPLSPAIGPFLHSETWFTQHSRVVHTLRYEAPASDTLNAASLAEQLAPMAKATGWNQLPTESSDLPAGYHGRWSKDVESSDGPTRLLLFTDGGLESVSLYCLRADLKKRDYNEVIAALNRTRTRQTLAPSDAKTAE